MRLIGNSLFPDAGLIFIPAHLRTLYVPQDITVLDLSAWANLTFGAPDTSAKRVHDVLVGLEMDDTLRVVREDLRKMCREHELHNDEEDEETRAKDHSQEDGEISHVVSLDTCNNESDQINWYDAFCYAERAKIDLARALIMNPEVLVLQRPLAHYDEIASKVVTKVLLSHVRNRGYMLDEKSCCRRRPRTLCFSPTSKFELVHADIIWEVSSSHFCLRTTSLNELTDKDFERLGLMSAHDMARKKSATSEPIFGG
eukprot:gnl/TRDRNA2_/TRDRNA2_165346_c0_seq3.p1 gnl/TRDRNA2_/TRDRNA2_165346_c0~~gnl/TRDRNA2_/TRDRNA2_165346_c0_seq3.p1  ORF type:complete len:256 (-),score=30.82 gnl/TRDRNA2_/TRDRNA2_165346_c0_seq3:33-800(-)